MVSGHWQPEKGRYGRRGRSWRERWDRIEEEIMTEVQTEICNHRRLSQSLLQRNEETNSLRWINSACCLILYLWMPHSDWLCSSDWGSPHMPQGFLAHSDWSELTTCLTGHGREHLAFFVHPYQHDFKYPSSISKLIDKLLYKLVFSRLLSKAFSTVFVGECLLSRLISG